MAKSASPSAGLVELSRISLVDAHCHPMRPLDQPLTVATFEQKISLSFMEHNQLSRARRDAVRLPANTFPRPTVMLNYLYHQLGDFLGAAREPQRIIEARNERAQDYPAYVRALMKDAGIGQLVLDSGYPGSVPCDEFSTVARLPVWEILRIDQVMNQVAQQTDDFGRFVDLYRSRLDEGLRDDRCVGLKSVIAYLTGLDVGPEDAARAREEFPAFRQEPDRQDFKALRDYCFHLGLQLCLQHDKVMQIHCGFGDDDIRFSLAAPHHLYELFAFPPYSDCLVSLVHGGYPWHKEAAIMASLLPNVFMDISETCPFVSYGVADLLWDVLQIAPFSKVMYGSDAFHLPELYWLGAKLGRRAVNDVLSRLLAEGFLNRDEALQIARKVLADNAIELYGLTT